jgi:hypothetical protein
MAGFGLFELGLELLVLPPPLLVFIIIGILVSPFGQPCPSIGKDSIYILEKRF